MKSHTLKPLAIAVLSASFMTGVSATGFSQIACSQSNGTYSCPGATSVVQPGAISVKNISVPLLQSTFNLGKTNTVVLIVNGSNTSLLVAGLKEYQQENDEDGFNPPPNIVLYSTSPGAGSEVAKIVGAINPQDVGTLTLSGQIQDKDIQSAVNAINNKTGFDLSGYSLDGDLLNDYTNQAAQSGVFGVKVNSENASDVTSAINQTAGKISNYELSFDNLSEPSAANTVKNIAAGIDNASSIHTLNISVGKNVSPEAQDALLTSMSSVAQSKGVKSVGYENFNQASAAAVNTALANTQQSHEIKAFSIQGSSSFTQSNVKLSPAIQNLLNNHSLESVNFSNTNLSAEDAVGIVGYAAKEAQEHVGFNFSDNPLTGESAYRLPLAVFAAQASNKLGKIVLPASAEIQTATAAYGVQPLVTAQANGQADMIYSPAETESALLQRNLNLKSIGQYLNNTQEAPKEYMKSYSGLIQAIDSRKSSENSQRSWVFDYDSQDADSNSSLANKLLSVMTDPEVRVVYTEAGATAQNLSSARRTFRNVNLTGVTYDDAKMDSSEFYNWGGMVGDHKQIDQYANHAVLNDSDFEKQSLLIRELPSLKKLSFVYANDEQTDAFKPGDIDLAAGVEVRPIYGQRVTSKAVEENVLAWSSEAQQSGAKFIPVLTTSSQNTSAVKEALSQNNSTSLVGNDPSGASSVAGNVPVAGTADDAVNSGRLSRGVNPPRCAVETVAVPRTVAIDRLSQGQTARFRSLNQATTLPYAQDRAPMSSDTAQ